MTRPMIGIQNLETGEEIIREMNDEEFAQFQLDQAANAEAQAKAEADALQKQTILKKLGLTEEDAKLLLS